MKTTIRFLAASCIMISLFLGAVFECSGGADTGGQAGIESVQTARIDDLYGIVKDLDQEQQSLADTLGHDVSALTDKQIDILSRLESLEAMLPDAMSRLAALEPEEPDTTMVLDGVVLYHVVGDNWLFRFWHYFEDLDGNAEISVRFEVGCQEYESLEQVADSAYVSKWQGFRTSSVTRADMEDIYGEWGIVSGWRREYEARIYELRPGKFYVFSVGAYDASGNTSWTTSLDSATVPRPYIVTRVQ